MRIRCSPAAADDLQQLFEYIRPDSPTAARHVVRTIYDRASMLRTHPRLGRPRSRRRHARITRAALAIYRRLPGSRRCRRCRDCQRGSWRPALAARKLVEPRRLPREPLPCRWACQALGAIHTREDAGYYPRRSARGGSHHRAGTQVRTRIDVIPTGAADSCAGKSTGGNDPARLPGSAG